MELIRTRQISCSELVREKVRCRDKQNLMSTKIKCGTIIVDTG